MTMRVSLALKSSPTEKANQGALPLEAMLDPNGPRLIIGSETTTEPGLITPISPSAHATFGPRGAAMASMDGPLAVSDTGHHRVLIWNKMPDTDYAPADIIIGQPDFEHEGRNAKGEPNAATMNVPTGIAFGVKSLVVADAWNHRVLIWHEHPTENNQPADVVLGQVDFSGMQANRGAPLPCANTLNWCYGVSVIDERLVVSDTGNRRVLIWNEIPTTNGQAADVVVGQRDFDSRDENAGEDAGPLGLRWPHSVVSSNGQLMVSDAGTNRILVWNSWPDVPGVHADYVIGQLDFDGLEHNQGNYWPHAGSLNMPYGLACSDDWIVAADTANSRLVGWRPELLNQAAKATGLGAQPNFGAKGDNRWLMPVRDSICWPYSVSICGRTLIIADSGNNRILFWDFAS